jgi:hypothetical protein
MAIIFRTASELADKAIRHLKRRGFPPTAIDRFAVSRTVAILEAAGLVQFTDRDSGEGGAREPANARPAAADDRG